LLGRNYAELKEGARLVVATSELDPLLATWQYGVGRVAAMATDGIGPWSSAWVVDPEVERMWVQLTRWLLPTVVTEDLAVAEPDAAAIRYPRRLVPDANVDTYLSSLATLTGGDPRFDPALAPAPRARLVMREAWRPWAVVGFALALLAFTWGQLIARPRRLGVPERTRSHEGIPDAPDHLGPPRKPETLRSPGARRSRARPSVPPPAPA